MAAQLDDDPAKNPRYAKLPAKEFRKIVTKSNASRDIYGFTTILSLTRQISKRPAMKLISEYLLRKADGNIEDKLMPKFKSLMSPNSPFNVGVMLSERVLGLSLEVIPLLYNQLPEDLEFTKKQDDIKDPTEFNFDYYIIMSRYQIKASSSTRLYFKAEDEVFSAKQEFSFSFKSVRKDEERGEGGITHYKEVIVMANKYFYQCLPMLENL